MSQEIQQIIVNAQNGDLDAFRQLVETHQGFVYNVAFRFLADEEDARDAVQECFIRLWRNLYKFDARKKLSTWLYKIITNVCYDELRRAYNKYKCKPQDKDKLMLLLTEAQNEEDQVSNADLAVRIKCLSAQLKPRQRAVFVLRDLQDLNMDEIAQILNISVSAVKSNLYYARRNIRKKCIELGYFS